MSADRIGLSYPGNYGPPAPYSEPRHGRALTDILGELQMVAPPTGQAIALADVKMETGFDGTADFDTRISAKIDAATTLAEDTIDGQRQFLTATFDVPCRGWWAGELRLPRPPLQSVTSIKYFDQSGTQQTWAPANYIVTTPWRGPGRIERAPNVVFPTLQCDRRYPVTIRFVCGYGVAANLPPAATQAIFLIACHSMRYRGDDDETGRVSALEVPPEALNLLRSLSWGGYC
jgi:uncharacterized phiE125 gp8 family phage protein